MKLEGLTNGPRYAVVLTVGEAVLEILGSELDHPRFSNRVLCLG